MKKFSSLVDIVRKLNTISCEFIVLILSSVGNKHLAVVL